MGAAPASAGHNADDHSANMSHVANFDDGGTYRQGSDLAFWGTRAILGNYDNPGGFRVMDIANPAAPAELGQFSCPGPQADVSVFRDLVFLSVDAPRKAPECGSGGATAAENLAGTSVEGVRVVSIADPANPVQLKFVNTNCGSHTNTVVPDEANNRVLVYALSYPVPSTAQGPNCNANHRKISVIEVPLDRPADARVVSTPDVSPATGCHDVTVLTPRKLAGAACITEGQLWDISDPVNPKIISHIVNPAINIQHSTTFSWDGKTLVIGDELGGAAVSPGCGPGGEHVPLGALWFYDVTDPRAPVQKATYRIPQDVASILCTAHNFNMIPLTSGRQILVSAWYNGGTTVVDFTDPTQPRQLGHYISKTGPQAATWSSYWYNGRIYANNFDEDVNSLTAKSRGFDVFSFSDPVAAGALTLARLNPQTMEALPAGRGVTPAGLIAAAPRARRCRDRIRPTSGFKRSALRGSRSSLKLSGVASDRGCGARGRGKVSHVLVAVARRYGKRTFKCRYLQKLPGADRTDRLRLGRKVPCRRRPPWITAAGTDKWRYDIRARLPRGRYNIRVRAVDSATNWEIKRAGRGPLNVLWFRIR